jgi:hypothetical protein
MRPPHGLGHEKGTTYPSGGVRELRINLMRIRIKLMRILRTA